MCAGGEVELESNDTRIPHIGKAFPNYGMYILDSLGSPLPVGWAGEICVAGGGITAGYLNNRELTSQKFIPDSISDRELFPKNKTLFRTGDKGKMLADGSIAFLGRIDDDSMIKLRGIRIDLGEVSCSLVETSAGLLSNAAVVVHGEQSTAFLVAYVIFSAGKKPEDSETYLRRLIHSLPLPQYMCPALAISLDDFPRSIGGKTDMKALKALPLLALKESESEDLTDTEKELKEIWEEVLCDRSISVQITKQTDFFAAGGNSLLLMKLQARLQNVFGAKISLGDLFRNSALESLALQLDNNSLVPIQQIDWEEETALELDGWNPESKTSMPTKASGPLKIILTGATGFLGQEILHLLDKHENVSEVHCIAVRDLSGPNARTLPSVSSKVHFHAGDLSLPHCGLSPNTTSSIFHNAAAVIHNGANVSFLQTYASLRAPNVSSTKNLALLAARHQTAFHFISTAGVAHFGPATTLPEASVSHYTPPTDGSDAYAATKWASERFLERAAQRLALRVAVHRPSSIVGDAAPEWDIMHNTLKYSRLLHAVPDLSGWTGWFDFVRVEAVAEGVVGSVLSGAASTEEEHSVVNESKVEYIHESGERVVPVADLGPFLREEVGDKEAEFTVLPLTAWTKAARLKGLPALVGGY